MVYILVEFIKSAFTTLIVNTLTCQFLVRNNDDITREVKAKIEAKFQEIDVILAFKKFIEQKGLCFVKVSFILRKIPKNFTC